MRPFVITLATLVLAACGKQGADAGRQDPVERGRYIVHSLGMCIDCHSPMTPTGPDPTQVMQGALLPFQPLHEIPDWQKHAPKLAGLPNHTKEQVVKILTEGIDPDGGPPRPPMPPYRMTREDAEAVAEYLATLE